MGPTRSAAEPRDRARYTGLVLGAPCAVSNCLERQGRPWALGRRNAAADQGCQDGIAYRIAPRVEEGKK